LPTIDNNDEHKSARGQHLRAAREQAGLTRAQLAGIARCSISSLGFIEQGAVPERSAVLDRAWRAIEQIRAARDQ
jgi:transcriptional regulator with XRE-family HTH domain